MSADEIGHAIPSFRSRLREALASTSLPIALGRTLPKLTERRDAAFESHDFERVQADLRTRRRAAIDDLPELLQRFREASEAVGTVVHTPTDAIGAVATVLDILHQHNVAMVVKSKSMATEEIGLNAALESDGVEVVETDLGEFLVQAAGERPSHIIAPALHMTRERAAQLIGQVTGEKLTPDPDALVGAARRYLRDRFIQAGAGITGANALVAETGSVMLVSNEGNARLASSLPPVHIIIAGIDKLVRNLSDATVMMEALPRSATGQPISTYLSFDRSLDALKPRGMLVLYGAASGAVPPVDPIALMAKGSLYLTRPSLAAHVSTREDLSRRSEDIFTWVSSGELHLHIDRELPLAQASEAHTALEGRDTIGKVLLIP